MFTAPGTPTLITTPPPHRFSKRFPNAPRGSHRLSHTSTILRLTRVRKSCRIHARVRLPLLIIITDRTSLIDRCHTRQGSAGTPSSCVASGNATMPWPPRHWQCLRRAFFHTLCRHPFSVILPCRSQPVYRPHSPSMTFSPSSHTNLTATSSDLEPAVQWGVLDVLAQKVMRGAASSTNMDSRRLDLETLHQILQASGHTPLVG